MGCYPEYKALQTATAERRSRVPIRGCQSAANLL